LRVLSSTQWNIVSEPTHTDAPAFFFSQLMHHHCFFFSFFVVVLLVHTKIMSSTDTEYVVKLTYAELYNEELRDLLATTPTTEGLKIIDDPNLGPVIQNITEANFTSAAETKLLLDEGESRRHFGVTNMNAHSSRSHVMVRLNIESRKVGSKPANPLRTSWGKDKPHCVSTLNLVDLAGSERANKSGTSGQAFKEGAFINKSLLTLGTVISNLSEGKLGAHIPYRDSKLTRLLSSALGGNAKTTMITCISPASGNVMESLSTLRFASRAKRIVNIVQKNEILSVKGLSAKLAMQNIEMDQLRAKLEVSKKMGFNADDDGSYAGGTLKDKAVSVSRNMRNLRFLMTSAPKMMRGLKKVGMGHLMKKIQTDLKAAISGSGDLSQIIYEHTNIITTYLTHDRKLLSKVHALTEENESERIIGEEGSGGFGGVGGAAGAEGGDDYSDDGDDIMAMDAEEMQEAVTCAMFYAEDVRGEHQRRILFLEAQLAEAGQRERSALHVIEEQKNGLSQHEHTIRTLEGTEAALHKNVAAIQEAYDGAQRRIKELSGREQGLEGKLGSVELAMAAQKHELLTMEGDMVVLRNQCRQLEDDLAAANASRRSFEEEASRTRMDMRTQMDKMRNTLHHMLQQGGEEAKVIENQNAALQKELDSCKDDLEEATKSKERMEQEMLHLRSEIKMLQEQQKLHLKDLDISKTEVRLTFIGWLDCWLVGGYSCGTRVLIAFFCFLF
jgi:predicted  nucleic acid-binding Zn-ribbon protein